MKSIIERAEQVLDNIVRPQLRLHGGDIELLTIQGNTARIRLLGQCSGCPASYLTAEHLVLAELSQEIPELCEVVTDYAVSEDLIRQAKNLMGRHHG